MNTKKKRKKRRVNHYVVTVSDMPSQDTHLRRLPHGLRRLIALCILLIVVAVTIIVANNNYRATVLAAKEEAYQEEITRLTEENTKLNEQNALLQDKVLILSETVNEKNEVVNAIEERSVPTGFPLSVAADLNEKKEVLQIDGENVTRPMIEFTAPDGTYIVAAGDGTVSYVAEEISYGWEVRIDHANGYVTSYRTNTEPKVKVGDEVSRGGLLFEMKAEDDDEPAKLGYQIIYNEEYMNPSEILEING